MRGAIPIAVVLVLIVLGVVYVINYIHTSQVLYVDLSELSRVYLCYVRDHDGLLPEKFDDLVGERYFSVIFDKDGMSVKGPVAEEYQYIPVFNKGGLRNIHRFKYVWGGHISDYEIRKGQVYKKGEDHEVLFVDPPHSDLKDSARTWSAAIVEHGIRNGEPVIGGAMGNQDVAD